MRCCRSDWPGLCLFCCCQPIELIWGFGLCLFHKFSNYTPPSHTPQTRRAAKTTDEGPVQDRLPRRRLHGREVIMSHLGLHFGSGMTGLISSNFGIQYIIWMAAAGGYNEFLDKSSIFSYRREAQSRIYFSYLNLVCEEYYHWEKARRKMCT